MYRICKKIAVLLSIILVISSQSFGYGFVYAGDDMFVEVAATTSPNIKDAKLKLYDDSYYIYDGKAKKYKSVEYEGTELKQNIDYEVVGRVNDNVNAGVARETLKGKGKYIGRRTAQYVSEKHKE